MQQTANLIILRGTRLFDTKKILSMYQFLTKRTTLPVFLLILLFSCKDRKGYIADGSPMIINLDSAATHFSLVSRVDCVNVVEIEAKDSSIISDATSVQRVIENNGRYFILDDKFMSIKAFDSTGKYLYNVGALGMGRGEFVRIEEIAYFPPHRSLLVLCNRPTKMCEFTLDGHFIREVNMGFWATSFAFPSENRRLFYVNQNKSELSEDQNILLTDSAYAISSRMFDMPKHIRSTLKFSGGLYSEDGSIYFNPALSGTYYLMSNDTAKPAFRVNYGSRNVPPDVTELEEI